MSLLVLFVSVQHGTEEVLQYLYSLNVLVLSGQHAHLASGESGVKVRERERREKERKREREREKERERERHHCVWQPQSTIKI